MAAVNVAALLFIVMYYFAVVVVGVWGGRKGAPTEGHSIGSHGLRVSKRKSDDDDFLLRLFVANRELPRLLGVASMTATWVGGGYLNGTAEAVYKYGIVNCQAPIGYAMSLVLGGAFFATKMRLTDSLTMLDPFQTHYGRWTGLIFCVPAVLGEIFWTAAILAALGKWLGRACLHAYRTRRWALWVPSTPDWIGSLDSEDASQLVDFFLMTALGGIPWQVGRRYYMLQARVCVQDAM
ncbi:hypothetical protein HPB49_023480 [Dermacentor silvarum]|uniref:Uncharacterized protein n=1 Tax=Dermacentor silvarum TaxID=543639 RepID=A0ACB8D8S0_DERSI|nr:hypothetical protein HPB49_023480 [Dermacentor silvarum]